MKFLAVFACLIAAASALPLAPMAHVAPLAHVAVAPLAPAAVTYEHRQQSLIPVKTVVSTSAHVAAPIVHSAPILAAPIAAHGYGLGHGLYGGLAMGHGYGDGLGYGYGNGLGYGHGGLLH